MVKRYVVKVRTECLLHIWEKLVDGNYDLIVDNLNVKIIKIKEEKEKLDEFIEDDVQ